MRRNADTADFILVALKSGKSAFGAFDMRPPSPQDGPGGSLTAAVGDQRERSLASRANLVRIPVEFKPESGSLCLVGTATKN